MPGQSTRRIIKFPLFWPSLYGGELRMKNKTFRGLGPQNVDFHKYCQL